MAASAPILPADAITRKKWSLKVAVDSIRGAYWSRHMGDEGSDALIVRKHDLEKGSGDEVTTSLVAKLRGQPVYEGEKLEGAELKMNYATHKMRIGQIRQGVNLGTKMDQKRVDFDIGAKGREMLRGYLSELYEELLAMHMAGARGAGDEIQHHGASYTGKYNALVAPDSAHLFCGPANTRTSGSGGDLVVGDKMALSTINLLQLKAKKYAGGVAEGKPVKMKKVSRNGKSFWVLVVGPEVMQDIRSDVATAGWFAAQQQLIAAIGRDADFFKGGAGWFNGVIVDEAEIFVRFTDYGVGSNVPAARSMFCGANAGVVCHGMKGMSDGVSINLDEAMDDRGNEKIIFFEMILGVDKSRFTPLNGATATDFAAITVETSFTAAV